MVIVAETDAVAQSAFGFGRGLGRGTPILTDAVSRFDSGRQTNGGSEQIEKVDDHLRASVEILDD